MKRRVFLRGLTGLVASWPAARLARAVGAGSRVVIGRALYDGGNPDPRPDALRRLVWEVILRTSTELEYSFPRVRLEDPALYRTPLLYLAGDAGFPAWSEAQRANLRRYLTLGGTLLVDDAEGRPTSSFDASFRREADGLLPGTTLARLADSHSVFRSYYLIRRVGGRVIVSPWIEGLTLGDRTPVLYCRNDLGGAWARNRLGRWLYDCVPGGEAQRQAAFRLGVNVVLYALTVNYKQDQVHSHAIRERMR